MSGSTNKFVFKFVGDAKSVVAALDQIGAKAKIALGPGFDQAGKKAEQFGAKVARAATTSEANFNKIAGSAKKIGTAVSIAFQKFNQTPEMARTSQALVKTEHQIASMKTKLNELKTAGPDQTKINQLQKALVVAEAKADDLADSLSKAADGPGMSDKQFKALNNAALQAEIRVKQLTYTYKDLRSQLSAMKSVDTSGFSADQLARWARALENVQRKVEITGNKLVVAKTKAGQLGAELDKMATAKGLPEEQMRKLSYRVMEAAQRVGKLRAELEKAKEQPDNTQKIQALEDRIAEATFKAEDLRRKLASLPTRPQVMFENAGRQILGAANAVDFLRKQLMNANDVVRFVSQGITNIGRSLMFFVSLPAAAFLGKLANTAMNFEHAMVGVQKTSGITDAALADLTQRIRDLANASSTSHNDLAAIAQVIGQMQDFSPFSDEEAAKRIATLTQMMDMFAITTEQTGEAVVTQMGQIMAAFGKSMGGSVVSTWKLINVINILENDMLSNAEQIQTALAAFAPMANTLKMAEWEAAAFSSTLISLGLSADETGTALSRLTEYAISNADEVANMLKGVNAELDTTDKIIDAINENPAQFFVDLATAASNAENPAKTIQTILDTLEKRGGRGLLLLAQNVDLLTESLQMAAAEWENPSSVMGEYAKAIGTTKSQVGILKNNINDLGITAAAAFLPAVNTIIQVLIPALQMVGKWFQALTPQMQTNILLWGAIAVAAGPALFIIGQLLQGISFIFMGLGQGLRVVVALLQGIGAIVIRLGGLAKFMMGWGGAIVAGFAGVLMILADLGVDIAGYFKKLAEAAKVWGENLAANLASGLLAGAVRFITQAIAAIANLIASFFESHSPPKAGPLKTIDTWGRALMETFIGGFKSADFSILEEIAGTIERILTSGVKDEALVVALNQLARSRVLLAELMEKFNTTGVIDEDLLDNVVSGLGDMADKVKQLIRLNLQYKDLKERIARIEARRKQVTELYDEEIAAIGASNMSLEEKVAAIRAAQRNRDTTLMELDEEEAALEAQADVLKEQLDTQKAMIDTLQKQDDIFQRIADTLEQMRDAMEDMGSEDLSGALGDIAGGLGSMEGAFEGATENIEEVTEQFANLLDRLNEGKATLQGILDMMAGKPMELPVPNGAYGVPEPLNAAYIDGYMWAGPLAQMKTDLETFVKDAKTKWGEIQAMFKGSDDPDAVNLNLPDSSQFDGLLRLAGVAGIIFLVVKSIMALVAAAKWISGVIAGIETFAAAAGVSLSAVAGPIALIIGLIALLAAAWIGNWGGIQEKTASAIEAIKGFIAGIGPWIEEKFGITEDVKARWQQIWTDIQVIAETVWENIKTGVAQFGSDVAAGFDTAIESVSGALTTAWEIIKGALDDIVALLPDWAQAGIDLVAGFVSGFFDLSKLTEAVTRLAEEAIKVIKEKLGIKSPSTVFAGFGVDLIQGLIDGILSMITSVGTAIGEVVGAITGAIGDLFGGGDKSQEEGAGADVSSFVPSAEEMSTALAGVQSSVDTAIANIQVSVDTFAETLKNGILTAFQNIGSSVDFSSILDQLEKDVSSVATNATIKLKPLETAFMLLAKQVKLAFDEVVKTNEELKKVDTKQIQSVKSGFGQITSEINRTINAIRKLIQNLSALRNTTINVTIKARGGGARASGDYSEGEWSGSISAAASGGSVVAGNAYNVGELGEELFIPNQGGTIVPNYLLKRFMMSPGSLNSDNSTSQQIQVNINHPVVRDEQDIKKLAEAVSRELSRTIARKARYGGNI